MASVTIEPPAMLAGLVEGRRMLALEADTLAEALDALRRHPTLSGQIFDEAGALRQHVLCFHNETSTRWMESLDVPLRDGDVLTILQGSRGGVSLRRAPNQDGTV